MNELFIKRMKELLKDDFDAFINSLNENEVKGFYLNPQSPQSCDLSQSHRSP